MPSNLKSSTDSVLYAAVALLAAVFVLDLAWQRLQPLLPVLAIALVIFAASRWRRR